MTPFALLIAVLIGLLIFVTGHGLILALVIGLVVGVLVGGGSYYSRRW